MKHPSINKALRFTGPGGDLHVTETDVPPLLANEILVKVKAVSINPVDIQLWRSGLLAVVSGDKGMGRDFSGTVVSVGKDVIGWAEGDDVFGLLFQALGQGTFSQYINFNPASTPIAKKPNCFSHEAAASIPLVALTAYACLDWLPPSSGTSQRRVVVRGASGGTGSWLVQTKQSYNCHITAICSSKNAEYVRTLGADSVIDYTTLPVLSTLTSASTSQKYDLIIDCVGGTDILASYTTLLHPKGAYVTIVGDKTNVKSIGGPITYFTNPKQVWRYIYGWFWGPRYACVSLYQKSEYLEKVVGLGERGLVKCEVQEVIKGAFGEEEAWRRAIEAMEGGRVRGKIVLEIP